MLIAHVLLHKILNFYLVSLRFVYLRITFLQKDRFYKFILNNFRLFFSSPQKNKLIAVASCITLFLLNCNTANITSNDNRSVAILVLLQSTSPAKSTFVIPEDLADTVVSAPNHTGIGFQDKSKAVNGVRGAGSYSGSGDVFSLTATGEGSSMVLEWSGKRIANGVGIDFIVFENPFFLSSSSTKAFLEPTLVEVSLDNLKYCGFNPTYTYTPSTSFSDSVVHWNKFAGITPVLYNVETNPLTGNNLYDISKTGGEGFDLSDLVPDTNPNPTIGCDSNEVSTIQSIGFVYLRLTAATAKNFPANPNSFGGGADIDGVMARYRLPR